VTPRESARKQKDPTKSKKHKLKPAKKNSSFTPASVSESQNIENLRMIEEGGGISVDKGVSDGLTKHETDGASIGLTVKNSKVPKLKALP
jgi:hypothetical protein